jgi:hypothetical protein
VDDYHPYIKYENSETLLHKALTQQSYS